MESLQKLFTVNNSWTYALSTRDILELRLVLLVELMAERVELDVDLTDNCSERTEIFSGLFLGEGDGIFSVLEL